MTAGSAALACEIAARTGVTKRTVYYHFRSKDELITAYLQARDGPTVARIAGWLDETEGAVERRVAHMFDKLARAVRNPRWKGCGFLRAAAELATTPGHPALKVGSAHKKTLETRLASVLSAAGLSDANLLACQIMILLDGAVSEMLVHRDAAYIDAAGRAAVSLLANQKSRTRRARGARAALRSRTSHGI